MRLGHGEADQVGFGELVPELGLEADRVVLEGAHRLDDGGGAGDAADHLTQHVLFVGEVEIHVSAPWGGRIERER